MIYLKDIVRCFVLMALCLSISFWADAQVTIQFVSSEDYQPIEKVVIFSEDKRFSTVSDVEGICTIDANLKEEEILLIQHISFLEETILFKDLQKQQQFVLIPKAIELEELVIGVSKTEERRAEISNQIDLIKPEEIQLNNPQTSADLLTQTGNVYIQKSQMGGGSPVIRGFEANKVLIAVDGVKLNNAIYRGGHLQNVITIDPGILERAEVVYGPGSLIYGSDAIGGVMHFVTKNPRFSKDGGFSIEGNAMLRMASANNEKTAHIDVSSSFGKWASLSSISFSDFDDLMIGKKRSDEEGTWGQLPYWVTTQNGYDESIENTNPNVLRGTAYHQLDILQKIIYKPNEQHRFTLNAQYSTSSEIPRFDRLNDLVEGDAATRPQPKWTRWSYGPQNRLLASLQHRFTSNDHLAFNNLTTTLAYQKIDEDRIKRKFAGDQTVHNEEDVSVFSLNSDAQKSLNEKNQIQYGIEYTHNIVGSDAYSTQEGLRLEPYVLTRYPDEGGTMTTASAYVRHKMTWNGKLSFSDGLRFSFNRLTADFSDEVNIPEKSFRGNFNALTGAVGLTYRLTKDTRLTANTGTGFRAPNIDDSGKFFDPQDGMLVVPNFNIKPEYVLNADLGIQHKIAHIAQIQVDAFYNYLFNAIVRRATTLNGKDSLVFDGLNSKVFSNQNAGKAVVFGFSAQVDINFSKYLLGYVNHNFTKGRDLTEEVPLGHIPPQFGEVGFRWKHPKVEASAYIRYNGTKPEEFYSPFGEDKESEALNELYTPAWNTLNFKFNYPVSKYISVSGGVENILDTHYKPFSSGISGSGRNFILALRSSF